MLTGKQLRTLRYILDLTGADIAERMYVTKQTITSIETGKTKAESSRHYYALALKEIARGLEPGTVQDAFNSMYLMYEMQNEISTESH